MVILFVGGLMNLLWIGGTLTVEPGRRPNNLSGIGDGSGRPHFQIPEFVLRSVTKPPFWSAIRG